MSDAVGIACFYLVGKTHLEHLADMQYKMLANHTLNKPTKLRLSLSVWSPKIYSPCDHLTHNGVECMAVFHLETAYG